MYSIRRMHSYGFLVPDIIFKLYGCRKLSYAPRNWFYHLHNKIAVFIFVITFPILEELHLIQSIYDGAELSIITEDLSHAINHLFVLFRYYILRRTFNFIEQLHIRFETDPLIQYEDNKYFNKRNISVASKCKLYTAVVALFSCAGIFLLCGCFAPLHVPNEVILHNGNMTRITTRPLPFNTWVPFNEGLLPNYYWVYLYQGISMFEVITIIASFDVILYQLLFEISDQFLLLSEALSYIKERSKDILILKKRKRGGNEINKCENFTSIMNNELRKCILHHQFLIKTVNELTEKYNVTYFLHSCTVVGVICVSLYQCLLRTGVNLGFFYMISYTLTICCEFFFHCWIIEIMEFSSSKVRDSLFHSYWSKAPISYRSNYIIFSMMTQKPVYIKSFGLLELNLHTYGQVIRGAYSIFSVMKSKM